MTLRHEHKPPRLEEENVVIEVEVKDGRGDACKIFRFERIEDDIVKLAGVEDLRPEGPKRTLSEIAEYLIRKDLADEVQAPNGKQVAYIEIYKDPEYTVDKV